MSEGIKRIIASAALILFGLFLVIDDLLLGLIIFSYPETIKWLDVWINHWMWGAVLIVIGIFILYKLRD